MIANEKQYQVTKLRLQEFSEQLQILLTKNSSDILNQIHINSLKAKIDDFKREIAEYEALQNGKTNELTIQSLEDFGQILIQARIAKKWSQSELAGKLNLKEQQIQRYEADRYLTANIPKLMQIATALDIEILPIKALLNKHKSAA